MNYNMLSWLPEGTFVRVRHSHGKDADGRLVFFQTDASIHDQVSGEPLTFGVARCNLNYDNPCRKTGAIKAISRAVSSYYAAVKRGEL